MSLQWATKVVVLVSGQVVLTSDTPSMFLEHKEEIVKCGCFCCNQKIFDRLRKSIHLLE